MAEFFHPRYWFTWLGLLALRLLTLLPLQHQIRVADVCGRLLYYLLRRRRHITTVNIQVCFPHLSVTEQTRLVKAVFANTAAAMLEGASSWWWSSEKIQGLATFENMELLEAAEAKGKGVLLVGGHFTSVEIVSRLLAERKTFAATYRRQKNQLMDHMIKKHREAADLQMIEREETRQMLKALKKGKILWYAPDHDYGINYSVFVPFFGVPAATITATSKLVKFNNSELIFASFHRNPDNRSYKIVFSQPQSFKDYPSGDDETDAITINTQLEAAIRTDISQYMWAHRRFKSRPNGKRDFYEQGYKEYLAQLDSH